MRKLKKLKIGRRALSLLLSLALIFAMIPAFSFADDEPLSPAHEEYNSLVARMAASIFDIEAAIDGMGDSGEIDLRNGYSLDLKPELEAYIGKIETDLGVAAALAERSYNDPRFDGVWKSAGGTNNQANFTAFLNSYGVDPYAAAVSYLTRGGIAKQQYNLLTLQWFYGFGSALNPSYSAASSLLGLSEQNALPNGATLAELAENNPSELVNELIGNIEELEGYAAEAKTLLADPPDELQVTEEEYENAVAFFIDNIQRDIMILGDLATGRIDSELWDENINGKNYYNNTVAKNTVDKLNAALEYLAKGGYHRGATSGIPYINLSIQNQLTYSSNFTIFDVTFSGGVIGEGFSTPDEMAVLPVAWTVLDSLKMGEVTSGFVMTSLQQAKYNYKQSLSRLQRIKNDPSGIVSAVLSSNEDIGPLIDDLNTLLGSLDDIVNIVDTLGNLGLGADILDPILGQMGLSYSMLESLAGLKDLLNTAGLDTSGETNIEESINQYVGPIIGVAIDGSISIANGIIAGARVGNLLGLVDMEDAYNSAAASLDLVYSGLTENAAGAINGIFDMKLSADGPSLRDVLNMINPYVGMLSAGISLINNVIILYDQVAGDEGLLSNFTAGNLSNTTYTLADVCDDLAGLLSALDDSSLKDSLSGLFGDGGVGGNITSGITSGLAGLLGDWLNSTIGTDLQLGDADLSTVNNTINGLAGSAMSNLKGLSALLRATANILRSVAVIEQGAQDLFDGNYNDALSSLIAFFTGDNNILGSTAGMWNALVGLFGSDSGAQGASFAALSDELGDVDPGDIQPMMAIMGFSDPGEEIDPLTATVAIGMLTQARDTAKVLCDPGCSINFKQAKLDEFKAFIGRMKDCVNEMRDTVNGIRSACDWADRNFDEDCAKDFSDKIACYYMGQILDCLKDGCSYAKLPNVIDCCKDMTANLRDITDFFKCANSRDLMISVSPINPEVYWEDIDGVDVDHYSFSTNYDKLRCELAPLLNVLGVSTKYELMSDDYGAFYIDGNVLCSNGSLPEPDEDGFDVYSLDVGYVITFNLCCYDCEKTLATKTVDVTVYPGSGEQEDTYAVYFDLAGGALIDSANPRSVPENDPNLSLPGAEREGYTFEGWYIDDEYIGGAGDDYEVTGDVTLTAHWLGSPIEAHYTISFDPNGGSVSPTSALTGTNGRLANLPVPTRSGNYTFDGWYTAATGGRQVDANTTFDSDSTVFAHWTYTGGGGGGGGGGGSAGVIIEEEGPPLADAHTAYIYGYEDGTVRPDGPITRAEVAMIFWRLLPEAQKLGGGNVVFSDVNDGAWYAEAVNCLAGLDVLKGYEDGTFMPNAPITREEFTAVVCRYYEATLSGEDNPFNDVDPGWAYDYILTAADLGWIVGYSDGAFKPKADITRAEVVTLVNRILERKTLKADIPAEYADKYSDLRTSHWAYQDIIEASVDHIYILNDAGTENWE